MIRNSIYHQALPKSLYYTNIVTKFLILCAISLSIGIFIIAYYTGSTLATYS